MTKTDTTIAKHLPSSIKTKLFIGTDAIGKATADIAKVGKKLDQMIQVAGLSCLHHVEEHKDVTVLVNLFEAMPQGSRKKALLDWVLKYGKVLGNYDDKGILSKDKPFLFDRKGATDLVGAEAEPWYNCAPDKLEVPMDFLKLLDSLLKKADKAEQGVGLEGEGAADLLKAVRAARNNFNPAAATAVEA